MSWLAKIIFAVFFTGMAYSGYAQVPDVSSLKPDPEKEKKFAPYIEWKHGWKEHFAEWKNENTLLYYKELWYYSESFYIKRNYLQEGITLNEAGIDISRYEKERKENEEAVVILPGYKDVLVLLPNSKLIYKP